MNAPRHSIPQVAISGILIVWVWLVFFWPVLSGRSQFGFRDTASMYQPLFQWIDQQWSAGTPPLWNRYDDFGMSVTGDASSSLFYPGKLLFFLPALSFELQFAWYVSLHVLLAAGAAWLAARTIGCTVAAATLASISYAFGGAVVFQTCNVIYLVGAAWLPATLACAWQFSRSARWRWLAAGSATLSLMVLGGDPQMAFVAGLICLFLIWTTNGPLTRRWRIVTPFLLLIFALALSAIQVLPAIPWNRKSERANIQPPLTVAGAIQQGEFGGLIREPATGTHGSAIYEFSFAPWRVVEAFWPNAFGQFDFVTESNWASKLPGADRLWTPSIYFSVIVALLALAQRRFRRPAANQSACIWQLTWITGGFLVASFGWYGFGWLVNELQMMRGGSGLGESPGRPVGGLYWILVSLLPGFSNFRYPAKLLVVAALTMCLLGGIGLDRLCHGGRIAVRDNMAHLRTGIVAVSVAGVMVGIPVFVGTLFAWHKFTAHDMIGGAANEILHSIGHSLLALAVLTILLWTQRTRVARNWPTGWVAWSIVVAVAIDVTLANRSLQGFVPFHTGDSPGLAMTDNTYRSAIDFQYASSLLRPLSLAEIQRLDRLSLRPKYHLPQQRRVTGSFMSVEPVDLLAWKLAVAGLNDQDRHQILGAWGIEQSIGSVTILPASSAGERKIGREIRKPGSSIEIRLQATRLDSVDRFWLARQWTVLPLCNPSDWQAVAQQTDTVLEKILTRGIRYPVLESNELESSNNNPLPDHSPNGRIQVVGDDPARILLDVQASQESLLVCCDYFDQDWQATLTTADGVSRPVSIVRANRILRAIPIPSGRSTIAFAYRPQGIVAGITISVCAWLILLLGVSTMAIRRGLRGQVAG